MSALRRPAQRTGPALERIVTRTFAGPVPHGQDDRQLLLERWESLYGTLTELSWLTDGPMVSYHHMARTVVEELGPDLVGVDLVITVDASPDCLGQSFPGPVLSHLLPGDPIMMGVSEQGVAGPFTALRIAHRYLRSGSASRALILIMEQSTLPPDDAAVRPVRDVAVALILGPEGSIGLDLPTVAVRRTGPAAPPDDGADLPADGSDLLVAGASLTGLPVGVPVRRAEPGHPCAGVWLALADLLATGPNDGQVLVADQDPVLPYRCAVTLTLPAANQTAPSARAAEPAGPPAVRNLTTRTHRAKELVR